MISGCGIWIHCETIAHYKGELGFSFRKTRDLGHFYEWREMKGFEGVNILGKILGVGIDFMEFREVKFLEMSEGKGCKSEKHSPSLGKCSIDQGL